MGPLCNQATIDRVKSHVAQAQELGAEVWQHGTPEGNFYPPTVLTNVPLEADVMTHETFGPVIPVVRISSADEAIEIANSSGMGLVASLWTRDLATAWRVGEALPHGAVNINETSNYWDQLAPFGGAGRSGVGRELGDCFFEAFMEPKLLLFELGDRQRVSRESVGGW